MPVEAPAKPKTQTRARRDKGGDGKRTATATVKTPPRRKHPVSRVYIMTDLEGVAGVLDSENWCLADSRYLDMAKEFLTLEVNAAVEGFFSAGVKEILVADGHGYGGINPELLDPRVELLHGWKSGWPFSLEEGWEALAHVGQHAKARTEYAHLCHTGSMRVLDQAINRVSVGEFGDMTLCASELGVPSIFGSGDLAFTKEAQALAPGIETVAVKRGTRRGRGDELDADAYRKRNVGAIHRQPQKAREMIRAGAAKALTRAQTEDFGIVPLKPPFKRVTVFRHSGDAPRRYSIVEHSDSVAALMNMPLDLKPIESEEQLAELLAQSNDPAGK